MKKEDWIIITLLMLIVAMLIFGIEKANRICKRANPDDINGYRFCLGI